MGFNSLSFVYLLGGGGQGWGPSLVGGKEAGNYPYSLGPWCTPACGSAACWKCRLGRVRVGGVIVHAGYSDVVIVRASLFIPYNAWQLMSCWPPYMSARRLEVRSFTQNLAFMNLTLSRFLHLVLVRDVRQILVMYLRPRNEWPWAYLEQAQIRN